MLEHRFAVTDQDPPGPLYTLAACTSLYTTESPGPAVEKHLPLFMARRSGGIPLASERPLNARSSTAGLIRALTFGTDAQQRIGALGPSERLCRLLGLMWQHSVTSRPRIGGMVREGTACRWQLRFRSIELLSDHGFRPCCDGSLAAPTFDITPDRRCPDRKTRQPAGPCPLSGSLCKQALSTTRPVAPPSYHSSGNTTQHWRR